MLTNSTLLLTSLPHSSRLHHPPSLPLTPPPAPNPTTPPLTRNSVVRFGINDSAGASALAPSDPMALSPCQAPDHAVVSPHRISNHTPSPRKPPRTRNGRNGHQWLLSGTTNSSQPQTADSFPESNMRCMRSPGKQRPNSSNQPSSTRSVSRLSLVRRGPMMHRMTHQLEGPNQQF
jgi:hypothetical protein